MYITSSRRVELWYFLETFVFKKSFFLIILLKFAQKPSFRTRLQRKKLGQNQRLPLGLIPTHVLRLLKVADQSVFYREEGLTIYSI